MIDSMKLDPSICTYGNIALNIMSRIIWNFKLVLHDLHSCPCKV
jgi:hypothetical protein